MCIKSSGFSRIPYLWSFLIIYDIYCVKSFRKKIKTFRIDCLSLKGSYTISVNLIIASRVDIFFSKTIRWKEDILIKITSQYNMNNFSKICLCASINYALISDCLFLVFACLCKMFSLCLIYEVWIFSSAFGTRHGSCSWMFLLG